MDDRVGGFLFTEMTAGSGAIHEATRMKQFPLMIAVLILLSGPSFANEPLPRADRSKNPICASDVSKLPIQVRGLLMAEPDNLVERAIRPGLRHVQQATCRCLPRRSKRQPSEVRAVLHIAPNAGTMTVKYAIGPEEHRFVERTRACLGEPVVAFEPVDYVSDMVTPEGRVEEIIRYPLLFQLREE